MSDWGTGPRTADELRADIKHASDMFEKATRDYMKPQRYRPHVVKLEDDTLLFGTLDTKEMVLHPPFSRLRP